MNSQNSQNSQPCQHAQPRQPHHPAQACDGRRARLVACAIALVAGGVARAGGPDDAHPLAPPDLSSPRATVASFRDRCDALHATLVHRERAAADVPRVRRLIGMVLACLDLGAVAPSLRESEGREAAVHLKEVLDRIKLPAPGEIPDAEVVEREKLVRWRLPETEIALVRLDSGPRAGDWVFDGETVERAEEFFGRVHDLPYRADAGSPGLRDLYVDACGWMIPEAWIRSLPQWARGRIGGETVWRWLALGGLVAAAAAAVALLARWTAALGPRAGRAAPLISCITPAAMIAASLLLDELLTSQVRLTGDPLFVTKAALRVASLAGAVLLVPAVLRQGADVVVGLRRLRPGSIDSQLVHLGFKLLTMMAIAWMAIEAADSLGVSVAPVLAGLGVGGLALALAAQHTVENLIAGLVLFADAPVRIGDVCQFGDLRGTVEQIGLRSTRIRGPDRTLTSIPNSEFAKLQLVNYSRRDRILLKTVLQLRYETTADQMRFVLAGLRTVLAAHPRLRADSVRVRFVGYGSWSLDVEVIALAETSDHGEFLAIQEDVLLRIMDVVVESGCGFAFPSQTHYQATDIAPDAARVRQAESVVAAWRQHDGLRRVGFLDTRPDAIEENVCPMQLRPAA
jgi:MscS family membrane protein